MNPPMRLLGARHFVDRRSATRAESEMKRLSADEKWRWAFALSEGKLEVADTP